MRVVDARQLDVVFRDEAPDVELGPVRQREDAEVLASLVAAVVDAPKFGSLGARVPLPERVTERVHALFGSRSFFVAASPAEYGIKLVLGNRVKQGDRLQRVAAGARAGGVLHASGID